MKKRVKIWTGVGAAALISATALAGCSGDSSDSEDTKAGNMPASAETVAGLSETPASSMAQSAGEGSSSVISADHDAAYLTQLSLMRGHLLVGLELYRAGALEQARTHMKHPSSELYAGIEDALNNRGAAGFAPELERLSSLVNGDAPSSEIETAYVAVLEAITKSEGHVSAKTQTSLGPKLQVAVNLIRTAADEYALGVKDGIVVNEHEYQDAYGFTQTAKQIVSSLKADAPSDDLEELAKISGYLDELAVAWPNILPSKRVNATAAQFYSAAARIEIVALGFE